MRDMAFNGFFITISIFMLIYSAGSTNCSVTNSVTESKTSALRLEHSESAPARAEDLGLLSLDYSVVKAFIYKKWGGLLPPEDFLMRGKKPQVDNHIGPWGYPWDESLRREIGNGLEISHLSGESFIYRDHSGVRLILEDLIFPDTLILSSESKYKGKLVRRDLRNLRTESGVGLGDSEKRLLGLLGHPSRRYRFGQYYILWYLQKPKPIYPGKNIIMGGHAAAYALKRGKVVEIWLHEWDNEHIG